jgi:hypothetical protein
MARKKKEVSKREKVFNVISNAIDFVQEYYMLGIFLIGVTAFIYVVLWVDTVAEIKFEIIYM